MVPLSHFKGPDVKIQALYWPAPYQLAGYTRPNIKVFGQRCIHFLYRMRDEYLLFSSTKMYTFEHVSVRPYFQGRNKMDTLLDMLCRGHTGHV